MAWMPVDQFLPSHEKTAKLARAMGWTPRYACGFLLDLWGWAIDHQPDGYIERADRGALARGVRATSSELARCLRALRSTGWIDGAGPTEGRLHEWDEWGGKIVARREDDRARQRKRREADRNRAGVTRDKTGSHARQASVEGTGRTPSVTRDVHRDKDHLSRVTSDGRQDKTRQDEKGTTVPYGTAGESASAHEVDGVQIPDNETELERLMRLSIEVTDPVVKATLMRKIERIQQAEDVAP